MAAITICSDFGAQKNKVSHCLHCFPTYLPWSDGTGCHDLRTYGIQQKVRNWRVLINQADIRGQMCVLSCFTHVQLFAILWTVACQTHLSMGFPRQEYWSGLPRSSPEDLSNTGIAFVSPVSPALAGGSFATEPPGKPTLPQLCPRYSWNKPHVLFSLKLSCFRILSPQMSVWLFHLVWDFTQKSFTSPLPSLLLISIWHWTCTYLSHILSASPATT